MVTDEATLSKEELERIKLALEITELRRPWWQKSTYAVNALIGLCSVCVLFITGSFQANSLKIQNERFMLDQQRSPLHQEIDRLTKERDEFALEAKRKQPVPLLAGAKLVFPTASGRNDLSLSKAALFTLQKNTGLHPNLKKRNAVAVKSAGDLPSLAAAQQSSKLSTLPQVTGSLKLEFLRESARLMRQKN